MAVMAPEYVYTLHEKILVEPEVRLGEAEVVDRFVKWGAMVSSQGRGALAPEAEALRATDPFLSSHLQFFIEGIDLELWTELIVTQMSLHADRPGVLFHELVCFWGIFDLWRGVDPRFSNQRLGALMGDETVPLSPSSLGPMALVPNLDALLVPEDLEEL